VLSRACIYLYIYFCAQGSRFPRAVNLKKEMKHVWKGHGAGSEIGNVSGQLAGRIESLDSDGQALEKKSGFSRVSRHLSRFPIRARNSWALALKGPRVSRATGKKSRVRQSEMYLFVFLAAAISAALAPVMVIYYPAPGRGTGYCFRAISSFVSFFLCQQHYEKTAGPICMKF